MTKKRIHIFITVLMTVFKMPFLAVGQPPLQKVKVIVSPDHADWFYHKGEAAVFNVEVFRYNTRLKDIKVTYELGTDMLEPSQRGTLDLAKSAVIHQRSPSLVPGFVRCKVVAVVDGKSYEGKATIGVDPHLIAPTVEQPKDFNDFWSHAIGEVKKIPLDSKIVPIHEMSTEKVNTYHVSFQNDGVGSRIYGILTVPKKEGKYPALLKVPGAGIRPYMGDQDKAEKGIITLEIGIHGVPVNQDKQFYADLYAGALRNYMFIHADSRDRYYYKRVYLGCVKAIDFLCSLPQFDGERMGVMGGSQGGALAIVTAALDSRVQYVASYYPALSDMTGYLHGRGGGWPHIFNPSNAPSYANDAVIRTMTYYDVVNFAKQLQIPGLYSWGFNDAVCPPASTYSVYNSIDAPKELLLTTDAGHWTYPEQMSAVNQWMIKQLKKEE